ncbi:MAG: DUF2752 domain-containing protein [Ruminococcus sp.]
MKRRKKVFYIFLPFLTVLLFYLTGFIYKKLKRFFILPCVFHMLTGYYCCGCGGTRSFFALLHGNISKSIRYNPIVVFGVILLFMKWLEMISDKKIIPQNRIFWYTVPGIFLLFYIIRNFIPILAPV